MSVTEQLRQAIVDSGETHYRVGKNTGVDTRVLDRFVSREIKDMMGRNIDRLCDYLGLQLYPVRRAKKKAQTTRKQAAKKTATRRKQRKKSAD